MEIEGQTVTVETARRMAIAGRIDDGVYPELENTKKFLKTLFPTSLPARDGVRRCCNQTVFTEPFV
jgi:hypothetical protein